MFADFVRIDAQEHEGGGQQRQAEDCREEAECRSGGGEHHDDRHCGDIAGRRGSSEADRRQDDQRTSLAAARAIAVNGEF